jgi:hypothetical protein
MDPAKLDPKLKKDLFPDCEYTAKMGEAGSAQRVQARLKALALILTLVGSLAADGCSTVWAGKAPTEGIDDRPSRAVSEYRFPAMTPDNEWTPRSSGDENDLRRR